MLPCCWFPHSNTQPHLWLAQIPVSTRETLVRFIAAYHSSQEYRFTKCRRIQSSRGNIEITALLAPFLAGRSATAFLEIDPVGAGGSVYTYIRDFTQESIRWLEYHRVHLCSVASSPCDHFIQNKFDLNSLHYTILIFNPRVSRTLRHRWIRRNNWQSLCRRYPPSSASEVCAHEKGMCLLGGVTQKRFLQTRRETIQNCQI